MLNPEWLSPEALAALAELAQDDGRLWPDVAEELGDLVHDPGLDVALAAALVGDCLLMAVSIEQVVTIAAVRGPTALEILTADGLAECLRLVIVGRLARCGLKAANN